MRRLPPPPPFDLQEPEPVLGLLRFAGEHAGFVRRANEEYWSWDELRRQRMPAGSSPETAWSAVRLLRWSNARPLPLAGARGAPFVVWLTDRVIRLAIEAEALSADPFRTVPDAIDPATARSLAAAAREEEATWSSIIEGAAVTRRDAIAMLRERRQPRTRDERMVVNNYRTMELIEARSRQPLDPELIREIHRSITEGTLDEPRDGGRLQQPGERRVWIDDGQGEAVHHPPDARELPRRIEALCDFANSGEPWMPDLVRASLLHFQLAHDHPFVDGNGRTARALFYWYLHHRGNKLVRYLSLSREINRSRTQYGRAYLVAEKELDVTRFVLFHLQKHEEALRTLRDAVLRRRAEVGEADLALSRWDALNLRQKSFLHRLVRDTGRVWWTTPYASEWSVAVPTAGRDLDSLYALGLLRRTTRGRRFEYRAVEGLGEMLATGPLPAEPDPAQLDLLDPCQPLSGRRS